MASPIPRDRTLLSEVDRTLEEAVVRSGLEPSTDLRLRLLEGAVRSGSVGMPSNRVRYGCR